MTDVKAERIYSLDCTRAICMLWIVALWHMESYLDITIKCYITDDICSGVLAAFTFISGYFLGKKTVGNVKELLTFYKKRILRFYPLFFVSCMIYYLFLKLYKAAFITGKSQLILTLTGLSCIFTPEPKTIWYISMLILFYAVTPLICCKKSIIYRSSVSAGLIALLLLLKLVLIPQMSWKLLLYFPTYCIGIILSDKTKLFEKPSAALPVIGVLLGGGAILLQTLFAVYDNYFLTIIVSWGIGCLLIFIGILCSMAEIIRKPLSVLSYAAMTAYLFHRQYFYFIYIKTDIMNPWTIYFVFLPLFFILCFFIQKGYDGLLKLITERIRSRSAE